MNVGHPPSIFIQISTALVAPRHEHSDNPLPYIARSPT